MANEHYVVVTVECSRCKTQQKIHVDSRTGFPKLSDQTVSCIMCDNRFKVAVSDKIIRGPFPA
jgi:hypothetical protein